MTKTDATLVDAECRRIEAVYRRRANTVDPRRYAPWQAAVRLERDGRVRAAADLLQAAARFPDGPGARCLEIGCGSAGWLPDLIGWGVPASNLAGIDLDAERASAAQRLLPGADVRAGSATALPWPDASFSLVIISTVFSSIADARVRALVAGEAARVTRSGGAVLGYDLARNNPANSQVRRISRREWQRLFPTWRPTFRSTTLAPPVARAIAGRSWLAAQALEAVPLFRTHLVAVFLKN